MRKYPKPVKTHGTIEESVSIDSFSLKKGALKCTIRNVSEYFPFTETGEHIIFHDSIKIQTSTISNITGEQTFFVCPRCGKKYRFLYANSYTKGFKCRKCARLNYRSTQKEHADCIEYFDCGMKFAKEKLNWTYEDAIPWDFPSYIPDRPKYMHKSTYERYMKKFRWYQDRYHDEFIAEAKRIIEQADHKGRRLLDY
ncbi:hypothetical protein [Butyrivibrio sp. XPD2002]|uniref:hypothetical protein n=1 Tax=Butyrivibrio sp. XPD2002 TaxID=1280665 RepID=UPI0004051FCD|nr:hypothetical protein [Butyrivibrio sp. XPD2002]